MKTESRLLVISHCRDYIIGIVYRRNSVEEIYFEKNTKVLPGRFTDKLKTRDEITYCISCDSLLDPVNCKHRIFASASDNLEILLERCRDHDSICEVIKSTMIKR